MHKAREKEGIITKNQLPRVNNCIDFKYTFVLLLSALSVTKKQNVNFITRMLNSATRFNRWT